MAESPHLRTTPAAEYLGISKRTLEGLRHRGGGPEFSRLGGVVVYRRDWLDAWVERNRRISTSANSKAAA